MMGNAWYFGWSWIFGLFLLVGIGLLLFVVVRMLISTGSTARTRSADATPGAAPPSPPGARQILDERFARGDLSTEQYRDQVQTLNEGR